ncbi:patatin-like phospholipase family protein [Parvularcula sp. IMCC14364]|uniref:patatin-like phospholipase family protein n=1 Tax=Parvularcula sp. IMCC14364 TaxID=3067902 RepID=UPI00274053BD|nr:patatin-like phospholipase family protein [Parvularcula sp. IMCC14364]
MPDRIHHTWDANGDASWEATGEAALPQMSDKDFVGLAFSGGGSRAALFAAAGAEALHDEGLLSHVTHVSSVSGGSMASSYLVASPPEQCGQQAHSGAQSETQSDRVACLETYFARYKGAMRENYFLPMEMQQVLHPNRFLSPTRRVTSLQETFDNKYLDGRTFGDLADGRILLINAASYDDGRRFVFSNMAIPTVENPPAFLRRETLTARSFSLGGCNAPTPDDFPVALAVAASAAFPPALGPVAIEVPPACDTTSTQYWHLGDGGILENTGIETLQEVLVRKNARGEGLSRAVIFSFDAGKREATEANLANRNLRLWTSDPGRVVSITNMRGDAYQSIVWDAMQAELDFPVRILRVRYSDHVPAGWPDSCSAGVQRSHTIAERLQAVPTRFNISDCDADLIEASARLGVSRMLQQNPEIRDWLAR